MDPLFLLVIIAVVMVLAFDFTNGFHDAANIVATVIASRAMTPLQAVAVVGVFEFLGPLLGGTAVANTVGSFVTISDMAALPAVTIVLAGLSGAIFWNLLTWWLGLPSSSSHALVGGMVGAVCAAVGGSHVVWGFRELATHGQVHGVTKVLLGLLLSPVAGFCIGFIIHRMMGLLLRTARPTVNRRLKLAQFVTAAGLAFSHGANDAQKSMGILTLVLVLGGFIPHFAVPFWVMMACATALTLGILSGGWRIVRTPDFPSTDCGLARARFATHRGGSHPRRLTCRGTSIHDACRHGVHPRHRRVRASSGRPVAEGAGDRHGLAGHDSRRGDRVGRRLFSAACFPPPEFLKFTAMSESSPRFFKRLLARIAPTAPDFHALLNEQVAGLLAGVEFLVEFMEASAPVVAARILEQQHQSEEIKMRNLQTLYEAFSTPFDREDIYRAIVGLDEVVNYCKTTVKEMEVLGVQPGKHDLDMAMRIRDGALALRDGYAKLQKTPDEVAKFCNVAHKSERLVEKAYRQALAELFQGGDFINMFKRREIYRHLSNTADRVSLCANTLSDIAVKLG